MLSHDRVWAAIDALAARHGMTASGLARKAGLDATSFNNSKRTSPEGRDRWPSTESIAKILRATGATLEDFLRLVEPAGSLRRSMVPLIGMTQAGAGKFFTDEGLPSGAPGWDEIDFPDFGAGEGFRPRGDRRFHGAALPRRRRADPLADGEHPQGRPGGRAHHRPAKSWPRSCSAAPPRASNSCRSTRNTRTGRSRARRSPGSRGSCGRGSKAIRPRRGSGCRFRRRGRSPAP